MFEITLDIFFPPTEIEILLRKISLEKIYRNCKKTFEINLDQTFSIFKYKDDFIKDAIYELKNNKNENAIKIFGEFMFQEILNYIEENLIHTDYKIPITWVPQHKSTYLEKGYNQAKELAAATLDAAVLQKINIFQLENLLLKTRKTKPQHEIKNKRERLKNLKNAFEVIGSEKIQNKIIILIDDIVTTGTTLKEVRRQLLAAGAFKVICFTIAH